MNELSQIALTGVWLLLLLNVAGGDDDGWVYSIRSFIHNSFDHLASLPLHTSSFISIPKITLSPFCNIILNNAIKSFSKISLGFGDFIPLSLKYLTCWFQVNTTSFALQHSHYAAIGKNGHNSIETCATGLTNTTMEICEEANTTEFNKIIHTKDCTVISGVTESTTYTSPQR